MTALAAIYGKGRYTMRRNRSSGMWSVIDNDNNVLPKIGNHNDALSAWRHIQRISK